MKDKCIKCGTEANEYGICPKCFSVMPPRDFEEFKNFACHRCDNDAYCPNDCDVLAKARRIPFEKIQKTYVKHDEDMVKIARYIRQYKLRGNL